MEEFENYRNLQLLLLSMKTEDDINIIQNFINENNWFSEINNKSTLRLIGSVLYSRPNMMNMIVKLLNKFESITIDNIIIHDDLADEEVILRYSAILVLCFLVDNAKFKRSSIICLRGYTDVEYFNPYKRLRINDFYSNDIKESEENLYEQMIKIAVAEGNMDMIEILSKKMKNLSSNQKFLEELFFISILYMRNDLIDYFITKYSIKINAEAYIKCIYSSNYDALLKIKELDTSKSYNDFGIIGSTPLDIAAFEGYLDFFKFFLTFKDIEINKLNSYGKNILQSAAKSNNIDIIKYIVENKIIDPNDKGNYNATPLDITEDYGYKEAFSYLVNYTSEKNKK